MSHSMLVILLEINISPINKKTKFHLQFVLKNKIKIESPCSCIHMSMFMSAINQFQDTSCN